MKNRAGKEIVFVGRISSHNSCIKLSLVCVVNMDYEAWFLGPVSLDLSELEASNCGPRTGKWVRSCVYRCLRPTEFHQRAKFLPDRLWFSYRLSANHLGEPHLRRPAQATLTSRYPVAIEEALLYATVPRALPSAQKAAVLRRTSHLHPLWAGP